MCFIKTFLLARNIEYSSHNFLSYRFACERVISIAGFCLKYLSFCFKHDALLGMLISY